MARVVVQVAVILYCCILLSLPEVIAECPKLFPPCMSEAQCSNYIPAVEMSYLKRCSTGVCCPYNIMTPLPTRKVERRIVPEAEDCLEVPKCPQYTNKYRTITGSCNNPIDPTIATQGSTYLRLLPADYEDGVSAVKVTGENGAPLPNVRVLRNEFSPDLNRPDPVATLLVMQFGQFISHDLSETPVITDEDGNARICCEDGKPKVGVDKPEECIPIEPPADDMFLSRYNVTCMEMVRSKAARNHNCSEAVREQFNVLSHYLDGSIVYGSTKEEELELREYKLGRLKTSVINEKAFLPPTDKCKPAPTPPEGKFCFKGGDTRANEFAGLALIQTFWLREHNRIARYLQIMNKHWDDEKIYQETRRIVAAEIQHITYKEYLPLVLGEKYMEKYSLLPKREGYSYEYSPFIDSTISNEHTTAGFRFGHSQIQGNMSLYGPDKKVGWFHIKDNFQPYILFDKESESLMTRGMYKQSSQKVDPFFTMGVSQMLFQKNGMFGNDLMSLNLLRGREHGLRGYNAYRKLCGLPAATVFEDFSDVIPAKAVAKLESVYDHVNDVDLFLAGLLEDKAEGSLLGPTFQCIIGDQFFRTKWGDRFFYDLGGRPNSFTFDQLQEIRKVTMARILCDNANNMDHMQKNVFLKCIPGNPFSYCEGCRGLNSIPRMNLDLWKEY